ncbi:hypothetical protein M501DRAFT_1030077 [Patellaria atrata CBS 101060]|uniref:ER lumen protein-retaining receptor n=1 Tax=Patellaria atrata CBS 101060 TaxID=1346257 RepID=A0A9P4VUR2_9PEZI|nr:hypothetical protein M501DRAFT_1030077 [Patellaria atrata CBS 101060]
MGYHMNVFRILADVSHSASKVILIWSIHSNRSAEGVSLMTQALYTVVFCARYMDLFWSPVFGSFVRSWNFTLKIFYIATSLYIVFIMMRIFARTREKEKAWKMGMYSLIGSAASAPLVFLIFKRGRKYTFFQVSWTFSIILESFCILPQLLLLRQTTVPTVIDSFYLGTLGIYRALYILNWVERGLDSNDPQGFDPIAAIFGIIQTAFYIDFAWVYFTRQRVKLRAGGVVDSDDLSRGWLVGKIIGRKSLDGDEEAAPPGTERRPHGNSRWGARGISISADEGVRDNAETERLTDPTVFEDGDLSDDEGAPSDAHSNIVGNGKEWRDDEGK